MISGDVFAKDRQIPKHPVFLGSYALCDGKVFNVHAVSDTLNRVVGGPLDPKTVNCNGEIIEGAFKLPSTGPIGLEGDHGQMEYRRIRISMSK